MTIEIIRETIQKRLRDAPEAIPLASQGGIGGCPYSPGASGNIVMEDLVFLPESMGLKPASISSGS